MLDPLPFAQPEPILAATPPLWEQIIIQPSIVSPDTVAIVAIAMMCNPHQDTGSIDAVTALAEQRVDPAASCIAIVDRGRPIGILTATDVVRLTATRQDLERLTIGEVMRSPLITLQRSAISDLFVVTNLLDRHQIHHLPIVDERDCFLGIVTSDSLQSQLTAAALQKLSERLSLSLKSGSAGCWEWDIRQDCYIWDERMYELYGQTRPLDAAAQHWAYATWKKSIHPADRQELEKKIAQALMQVAEFAAEFRVIHPDGSIHFLKAHGLVQSDARARPCRMVGISFDITAAKENEAIRQQTEQTIRQQADREFVLREMTQRIRKSLELPIVFETAVREIRNFLETDRVAIFKFASDCHHSQGEFVAESVDSQFKSILGAKIHDPDFGRKFARYYRQGRINAVEDIYTAGLQDSEVRVLAAYQVHAHLIIPLLNGLDLWGLLCVHHCQSDRPWQEIEIEFIRHIGEQIGIAIQQATLYAKVQSELQIRWRAEEEIALQLRQQRTLGTIAQQIRNSLKVEEILATAASQVKELMQVDRATIFQICPDGRLRAVEEVVSPDYPRLMQIEWERAPFGQDEIEFYAQGQPRIVVDVMQDARSLRLQECEVMAGVQSKIVAPILLPCEDNDTERQFDPSDRVQLWGLLSIHACSNQRQWQDVEAQLLQQIADQLAIAIQQATLFELLQAELAERQQAETQLRERNQQLAISNQELAQATQLKDEFLANMSHELRTPLNAILGMSEALQTSIVGDLNHQQQNSLATIEKSGKHLLSLINDILDLSKIAANKFVLELGDVSIQSLCQNSMLFVQELAQKRQIRLTTQLPVPLRSIDLHVDDLRFRQVLINLLSNAVKFTPEGGSVTLDVRVLAGRNGDLPLANNSADLTSIEPLAAIATTQQIVFSIVDTGIGIAPENISKLFQSFVQIDSSLNRQYAGTGLGLALVKRIVELHGGTVSVESELQRGSCFTVYLPFEPSLEAEISSSRQPARMEIAVLPAEPEDCGIKSKAAILVVEDNEANMETMTGYLQSRGYRLMGASNGLQAISVLESCGSDLGQTDPPDVILMDIQMPGMDGFEAIGRIRQIPDCATIPIVALTALAMPADRQKCLDAGADRYVTKPVKLGQLVSTIETLLQCN
jgi:signal transduction histidine kinase/CBS domain-containing protein/ActR/RegA family two-component response regulator